MWTQVPWFHFIQQMKGEDPLNLDEGIEGGKRGFGSGGYDEGWEGGSGGRYSEGWTGGPAGGHGEGWRGGPGGGHGEGWTGGPDGGSGLESTNILIKYSYTHQIDEYMDNMPQWSFKAL